MSSTSIDDLLSFEEERPALATPRRAGPVRLLLRTLAAPAVVVVVIVAGLRVMGIHVSFLVLIAGVAALFAVRRVVTALAPPPPAPAGRRASATGMEDGTRSNGTRDALRSAINGWEWPLDWSTTRPERFTGVILPRLAELADERLRLKHGVTRESDPARARALLGQRLWTFLSAPPRRTPSPRDLATIVAELEKI